MYQEPHPCHAPRILHVHAACMIAARLRRLLLQPKVSQARQLELARSFAGSNSRRAAEGARCGRGSALLRATTRPTKGLRARRRHLTCTCCPSRSARPLRP
jgi:hypothetical protein